ncbi:MAG TPA: hypothetical protein ENJ54_09700 [Chloroflexi bacterium]|nr:hypothetical protein [Chloroflexota bacterium]
MKADDTFPCTRRGLGLLLALTLAWAAWAVATAPAVPFHPDESTYLYMSADGAALLHTPLSLAYHAAADDLRQHYRLVNAPLTRYLVAAGLALGRQPALRADWDWSADWQTNVTRGALPTRDQLAAARGVMTLCTALAGLLLALTACRFGGIFAGALTLLLFLFNPLVLLHGRRAMMEAPMLLGLAWLLWEITAPRPQAWRVGLALAWGIWAKYWVVALAPVALWAVWRAAAPNRRARLRRTAWVAVLPLLIGFLLQPVLWKQPWRVLPHMAAERLEVTQTQRAAFKAVLPAYAPDTPVQRLEVILGQLYLAPPAYLDLGKYHAPLASTIAAYDAHPWAHWTHSLPVATLRLLFMLLGLAAMLAWARKADPRGHAARLCLLAAVFQWGVLLLTLPLAFQRYALVVLPWVILWETVGVVEAGRQLAARTPVISRRMA